ncbi:MAG: TrkA family potassium uptake protein [Treponema sp.]
MKIAITGGKAEADFLIASLKEHHKIAVVNPDTEYARYLADIHSIPVVCGDPRKVYVLEQAEIRRFDVLVSLMPDDADSLAVCQLAKEKFDVKKTIAVVTNPRNVELFRTFGVTEVVSSAYMVSQHLVQLSTLSSLVSSFSLENEKIVLTELDVSSGSRVSGLPVCSMHLPPHVIIACIIRNGNMIVPDGQTVVSAGDRLVVLSAAEMQNKLIALFMPETGSI